MESQLSWSIRKVNSGRQTNNRELRHSTRRSNGNMDPGSRGPRGQAHRRGSRKGLRLGRRQAAKIGQRLLRLLIIRRERQYFLQFVFCFVYLSRLLVEICQILMQKSGAAALPAKLQGLLQLF